MQAHSTVRQNLTAFFVVFGLIGALGVFLLYTSLVVSPASSSAILLRDGVAGISHSSS
mgnify:CR=1 FL=1